MKNVDHILIKDMQIADPLKSGHIGIKDALCAETYERKNFI